MSVSLDFTSEARIAALVDESTPPNRPDRPALKARHHLQLHRGPFDGRSQRAAYEALLTDVLGLGPAATADDLWHAFAFFDPTGRCAANIDAAILPLLVDGTTMAIGAIRSVAVAPAWRGRGLFRALMDEALGWCDARAARLTILYTEEPALYGRYGFSPMPQHAFVGSAPACEAAAPARRLDISDTGDRALITRAVEARRPLSCQVALLVPPGLVLANIASGDLAVAIADDAEALIVYEEEGDTLVLADVVTSTRPSLTALLGALGPTLRRLKTLFPPDRLEWQGEPFEEDTGLMVRGRVPLALTRPFMFPPTAEF